MLGTNDCKTVYGASAQVIGKGIHCLLEQIRTIDQRRLREHMGHLDEQQMAQVDDAIAVSFGLPGTNRAT